MALENLDQSLAQAVDQIQGLIQAHGPQAIQLAGRVYQLQAIGSLLYTPVFGGVAFELIRATRYFAVRWKQSNVEAEGLLKNHTYAEYGKAIDKVAMYATFSVISGVAAAATVLSTLYWASFLLNPVVWAAIWSPEVALAAHLLKVL